MKIIIYDIIELIAFIAILYLIYIVLIYFKIHFNYMYVFMAFLVLWVSGKMVFRRPRR